MKCLALYILTIFALLNERSHAQQQGKVNAGNRSLADVVQQVHGSTAFVRTEVGTGSGFYVTTGGLVATALHVVRLQDGSIAKNIQVEALIPGAQVGKQVVTNSEIALKAGVVAQDAEHDLALLQPIGDLSLKGAFRMAGKSLVPARYPATICDRSFSPRSGDAVFTIGHPLGDLRQVTTSGIVASTQLNSQGSSGALEGTYLVDMLINHGNSGGPVFTMSGCVIGIADSISLTGVEAISPDGKPLNLPVTVTITGADGKPLDIRFAYSTGLGTLIPQKYLIGLLDQAGYSRFSSNKLDQKRPAGRK